MQIRKVFAAVALATLVTLPLLNTPADATSTKTPPVPTSTPTSMTFTGKAKPVPVPNLTASSAAATTAALPWGTQCWEWTGQWQQTSYWPVQQDLYTFAQDTTWCAVHGAITYVSDYGWRVSGIYVFDNWTYATSDGGFSSIKLWNVWNFHIQFGPGTVTAKPHTDLVLYNNGGVGGTVYYS